MQIKNKKLSNLIPTSCQYTWFPTYFLIRFCFFLYFCSLGGIVLVFRRDGLNVTSFFLRIEPFQPCHHIFDLGDFRRRFFFLNYLVSLFLPFRH